MANCRDECPAVDGKVIGPNGCPSSLVIDFVSVGFAFDSAQLSTQSQAILNESVRILKNYPELQVEISGHTDLCGTEEYNEDLSFRRAVAVHDYLQQQGIALSRLGEPMGFGEQRPLVQTPQSYPQCKNATNRRTELDVQGR